MQPARSCPSGQLERLLPFAGVTQIHRQSISQHADRRSPRRVARPHGHSGPPLSASQVAPLDKGACTRGANNSRFANPHVTRLAFARGLDFFLIHKNFTIACKVTHSASSFQVGNTPISFFTGTAGSFILVRLRIKRALCLQSLPSPAGLRYDPQYRRGGRDHRTGRTPQTRLFGSCGGLTPMRAATTGEGAKEEITTPEPTNALLPACRDASRICS